MIYSKKWAFCHIPKNGGTNFKARTPKDMAVGYTQMPKNSRIAIQNRWWHQPIQYEVEKRPELKELQWVAIVRNPKDRLTSWYSHIVDKYIPDMRMPFEHFVIHNGLRGVRKLEQHQQELFEAEGGAWKLDDLQSKWVVDVPVKLKTYRLEDQLPELEEYVGFKFADTRHNYSSNSPYWTTEMEDICRERYKEDYERFGYA